MILAGSDLRTCLIKSLADHRLVLSESPEASGQDHRNFLALSVSQEARMTKVVWPLTIASYGIDNCIVSMIASNCIDKCIVSMIMSYRVEHCTV